MKKRFCTALLTIMLLFCTATQAFAEVTPMTVPAIDGHLHYQDFTQNSEGFEKLANAMKAINVEGAVIFGMPMTKMWDENAPAKPTYYMSNDSRCYFYSATDYILAEELIKYQAKPVSGVQFYPLASGVNANDKFAGDQLRHLFKTYPKTFYGIGEIMLRHDDLTALTYGEAPRPNSPGMFSIIDVAAEYKVPVLIHHNITASYNKTEALYKQELEELLKYSNEKGVNVIWAHVGASRRIELKPELMRGTAQDLLKKYPRLYVDISWVIYDDYINQSKQEMNAWCNLIRENPTRFIIGSDKVGSWGQDGVDYQGQMNKYNKLATTLQNDTVVNNLFKNNIMSLLPKAPIG